MVAVGRIAINTARGIKMKRCLIRVKGSTWYFVDGEKIAGAPAGVSGDLSGVRGDLTGVRGDLSGVSGDLSGVSGDLTGEIGRAHV